ncbi:SEC-C metal-binding domain-containing protein [Paenibacillus sp. S-38]|uniref:SEC-C metal-binding domain-containing protein n=1 Tax=Paenibacillus sp. S-38 TaxID=3416710 RepID=UPI003CF4D316
MDKPLNSKEQRMLLEALERAREMSRKMKEKEDKKLWADFALPLSLGGCLPQLTKHELSEIRSNLGIEGASALKKQDLTDLLTERIPELLPWLLAQWDETRYGILKKLADRGGQGYVELEREQLRYLREHGLVFTGAYKGKPVLAMPQEVVQAFKAADTAELRARIRQNTEWIQMTQGMLYYYGCLKPYELLALLKSYTTIYLTLHEYVKLLTESQKFHHVVRQVSSGWVHIDVDDPEHILEEHRLRKDVPFYPFSKEQLLLASDPDYVERHALYRAFVDFIRKGYELSKEEADGIVENCVFAIQLGDGPGEILKMLQDELEIDSLELMEAFMQYLVPLHNNTKQWVLKGYSPVELRRLSEPEPQAEAGAGGTVIDFATGRKVGRNDPCPCGSGAKFKKCCGK